MKSYTVTITSSGQITLPAEIRRQLGVKPGEQVNVVVDDSHVYVKPVEFTLETVFGSIPPRHHPEDIDTLIQEAKDDLAEEAVRRLKEN